MAAVLVFLAACGGLASDLGEVSPFEHRGVPIIDLDDSLNDVYGRYQGMVQQRRAAITDPAACYLVLVGETPADTVACGPGVFPGGDTDLPWTKFQMEYSPEQAQGIGGTDTVAYRLVPSDQADPQIGVSLGPSETLASADSELDEQAVADLGSVSEVPDFPAVDQEFTEVLAESPVAMDRVQSSAVYPTVTVTLEAIGSTDQYVVEGEPRVAPEGGEFKFLQVTTQGDAAAVTMRLEPGGQPRPFTVPQEGQVVAVTTRSDAEPRLVVTDGYRQQAISLVDGVVAGRPVPAQEEVLDRRLTGRFEPVDLCVDPFTGDGGCPTTGPVVYSGGVTLTSAARVSNLAMAAPLLGPELEPLLAEEASRWASGGQVFLVVPVADADVRFQPSVDPVATDVDFAVTASATLDGEQLPAETLTWNRYPGRVMLWEIPRRVNAVPLTFDVRLRWRAQYDATEGTAALVEPLSLQVALR